MKNKNGVGSICQGQKETSRLGGYADSVTGWHNGGLNPQQSRGQVNLTTVYAVKKTGKEIRCHENEEKMEAKQSENAMRRL